MPAFRNNQTGEVVNFEGKAALNAEASGLYTPLDHSGSVPVATPAGREVSVSPSSDEYGQYVPVTAENPSQLEYDRRQAEAETRLQNEYGGLGGEARALVEGGLSAITLGGYDVLNKEVGGNAEKYAKANPKSRLAGEVTGLLGASLIPGVGEEALGGVGGRLVSGNIAGAVSKGTGALAESLGGLKGAVAAQALEGAIYGTGQTLSQAVVTDEPLTAQALYAEVGRNALWGAGIGGTAGVLSHGLAKFGGKLRSVGEAGDSAPVFNLNSEAGRDAAEKIAAPLRKLDDYTENAASRLRGKKAPIPHQPDVDEAAIPTGPLSADDLPSGPPPEPEVVQPESPDVVVEPARPNMAQHKILKSAGDQVLDTGMLNGTLDAADVRHLRKAYARMDEAFTFAREDGTQASLYVAHKAAEDYADMIRELSGLAGVDVEKQLAAAKLESVNLGKSGGGVAAAAPAPEVVPPAEPPPPSPMPEEYSAAAENLLATRKAAKDAVELELGQAFKRHAVAKLLNGEPDEVLVRLNRLDDWATALRNTAEQFGDARFARRIDKALNEVQEAVEKATGGVRFDDVQRDVLANVFDSNSMAQAEFNNKAVARLHEASALARTMVDKLPKGMARKFALGSMFKSGMARAAGRGASGLVTEGGVNPGLLGKQALSGFAAATGYNVVHYLAALTSGSVGRIAAAVRTAGKVMTGAAKVLNRGSLTGATLMRQSRWGVAPFNNDKPDRQNLQAAFRDRSEELAAFAANPDAARLAIHDDLAPLRQIHPHVADELEDIAMKAPMYLYDKMPKDPGVVTRFGKSMWKPSEYEVLQWGEHMRGVVDPIGVYEEALQSGYITPQAADALRTIHPDLYQRMQIEVFQRADELRYKLDYQAQIRLSILFNVPVNSSMSPDFRAFMKQRYIARAQQSKPAGGQMGASSGSTSAAEPLTGAQQLLKQVG